MKLRAGIGYYVFRFRFADRKTSWKTSLISFFMAHEFTGGPREPLPGSYSKLETSLRSSYFQPSSDSYSSPSLYPAPLFGPCGTSDIQGGGYGNTRL